MKYFFDHIMPKIVLSKLNINKIKTKKIMAVQQTQTLLSTSQTVLSIQLAGSVPSGTTINIEYQALQGANPKELGYFVAIWQGTQIMGLDTAIDSHDIEGTSVDGDFNFDGLELATQNYTVGFGVNNEDGTTICATLAIPAGNEEVTSSLSSVTLNSRRSNSLTANYTTPAYNRPKTNKNWIALFQGGFTANMYKGINVVKTAMVSSDNNIGTASLSGVTFIRNQSYTLVYGMGLDNNGNPNFSNLISAVEF